MSAIISYFTNHPVFLKNFVFPLAVSLLSGCGVALFSAFIVNQHLKKLLEYKKLRSYGFVKIGSSWQKKSEVKEMCEKAKVIKVINVSGKNYYKNYLKNFEEAMKNGVEIYALVADPDTFFLTDIEEMEKKAMRNNKPIREKDTYIKSEIEKLVDEYKHTNLHMRFYRSEYRLPFILAHYKDGSIHTWLNVTLPPQRSEQAMVLRGEKEEGGGNEAELDFIDMMESSFDAIWDHSEWSASKVEKMRQRALAKERTTAKADPKEEKKESKKTK